MMRIIAGDVGGTKTLLQLVEVGASSRTVVAEQRYPSGAWRTFAQLLADFIQRHEGTIDAACFAVAGPVFGEQAEITNLRWTITVAELVRQLGTDRVALINDFFAVALGVPLLAPGDRISLNEGHRQPFAPIAILGAGTGLGEANLIHDGARWNVIPSEGGHADFGPQDEEQSRLFLTLLGKHGHVSWERILSGMGLQSIYCFLTGMDEPYDEREPARIAALADGGDPLANRAFEIFVDVYGAEAGNMALRVLARGGVFLAGGIAAKNLRHFTGGRFVESFLRKGRFTEVMREIPIDVIANERVGLVGAVEAAIRLL
jgi:glucokinase